MALTFKKEFKEMQSSSKSSVLLSPLDNYKLAIVGVSLAWLVPKCKMQDYGACSSALLRMQDDKSTQNHCSTAVVRYGSCLVQPAGNKLQKLRIRFYTSVSLLSFSKVDEVEMKVHP